MVRPNREIINVMFTVMAKNLTAIVMLIAFHAAILLSLIHICLSSKLIILMNSVTVLSM